MSEYTQALLWRRAAKEKLRLAEATLADAIEGMPRISLERVQAERALKATCEAIGSCQSAEAECEQRLVSAAT